MALLIAGCGGDDGSSDAPTTFGMPGSAGTTSASGDGTSTSGGSTGTSEGDGPTTTSDEETTLGPEGTESGESSSGDPGTDTGNAGFDGEPGDFTLNFDGRDYRMYVPSGYTPGTQIPLLVGFHGAGDSGANFAMFTEIVGMKMAAEPAAYILVVPDTKSSFSDWANWSGNPNNDVDAMIAEMDEVLDLVDDVGTHYNLDAQQLHAFGFSNGGLFSAIAGMARADRFATLSILGYGWGSSFLPPGQPSRAIPVQFGCGSADGFYGGAQASESFLAGAGHDTRLVTANGVGHTFSGLMETLTPQDMFAWMAARPL